MKTAAKTLLGHLGLAPAAHLERAANEARQGSARVKQLEAQLAGLREDSQGWKRKNEEAIAASAEWKKVASRAEAKAERAAADATRAGTKTDEWRTRAHALATQLKEMAARLKEANRAAGTAREHLMATEVKLDLLEAAIQVLDARTREASVIRS